MNMISRRQFLASSAACAIAGGAAPLCAAGPAMAAAPTLLRAESRTIEVAGKAARVYGLLREDGGHGLRLRAGDDFHVRLENGIDAPTLVHWHGLNPPYGQDGVAGLSQSPLQPGESHGYHFPLRTSGTHWMHAHTLQEQKLLAAPLIVADPAEEGRDEQELVVLLHDFSFREPEELLAGLTRASGANGHGAHAAGHGAHAAMVMDINDIEYDAFLANDRTLDDPEVFRVEGGGAVRLRIINGAAATAFWIDTGNLEGEAIAVDGKRIAPVTERRFPLGMGQRVDIRLRLPPGQGAWPILALREGAVQRTGFILATRRGQVARMRAAGTETAPALDLAFEASLRASGGLAEHPVVRRLPVTLGGSMDGYRWAINRGDRENRLPLSIRSGDRVELIMRNDNMMGHPMHLHGHPFQVVEINGKRLAGAMRDTVWLPPQSAVTIAFAADNPGTWPFHCHHLYHMAAGMMTLIDYFA